MCHQKELIIAALHDAMYEDYEVKGVKSAYSRSQPLSGDRRWIC
jgi:hypothetical protein